MKTLRIIAIVGLGGTVACAAVIGLHRRKPEADKANGGPATDEWLKTLGNQRRFPDHIARLPKNTDTFLSLALSGEHPRMVGAALHGLERGYGMRPQEAPLLSKAVLASLGSNDDEILGAALSAARPLLAAKGDPNIESRLLDLAGRLSQGPGRYALLDTLSSVGADRVGPPHIALAQASLQDKAAYVRSRALRFLEVHSEQILEKDQPVLSKAVTSCLTDSDPGVRGRAAVVLASLGRAKAESLRALLKDPIPFVQAQASTALARAGAREYLQEILELSSSTAMARYDIRGWTTLEGEPGCESHSGSPSGFLGEAAATALALLSHGQAKVAPIASEDVAGSLLRNRTVVAAWLASTEEAARQ
jgi:hypothetical protein